MEKTYNNDVICMMPWIHMHIWPNGNAMPCCMSDSSDVFGNTNHSTIDEIINNDKFKKLMSYVQFQCHKYNHKVIGLFKKDFWKEFI